MQKETEEYYNIACWLSKKLNYNRISKYTKYKRSQILHGQIWYCDLGFNVGAEKNKMRPVLVMSNNKINTSEKIVVISITDAKNKLNANNLPVQDSWFLLYSTTQDPTKMISPGRVIPSGMNAYSFLEKDSVVQCEEIRSVSKARLDYKRGCIGTLTTKDFDQIKGKFCRAYNIPS